MKMYDLGAKYDKWITHNPADDDDDEQEFDEFDAIDIAYDTWADSQYDQD